MCITSRVAKFSRAAGTLVGSNVHKDPLFLGLHYHFYGHGLFSPKQSEFQVDYARLRVTVLPKLL